MPNLKVSDAELKSILNELETDLGQYLNDARLAKAREEDGSASPGVSAGSPSASAGGGGSPSASASAGGSAGPSASVAPSEGSGPPSDASAMGAGPAGGEEGMEGMGEDPGAEGMGEDPAAGGPVDPAALEAEYAKLPVEELKAHYLAAKSALFAVMGQGAGAGPEAGGAPPAGPEAGGAPPMGAGAPPPDMGGGAPPMGAGGPPAGGPPGGAPPMEEQPLAQSEKDELDSMRQQLATMAKALGLLAGQPMQKGITGMTYVAKSELDGAPKANLSKAEITAKLNTVTRQSDLKKSDRDAINNYYETGSVDGIVHLLK
jgi:hypothetical protein